MALRAAVHAFLNIFRMYFTTSLGSPCQNPVILPCEEILPNVQLKPPLMQLKTPQGVLCCSGVLTHQLLLNALPLNRKLLHSLGIYICMCMACALCQESPHVAPAVLTAGSRLHRWVHTSVLSHT